MSTSEASGRVAWHRLRTPVIGLGWCLLLSVVAAAQGAPVGRCTEAELRKAIAAGGVVTFLCGDTITVTNTIVISNNVVLDGSGETVRISGGNAVRIFTVNSNVSFTLRNLTLADGKDSGNNGTNGSAGLTGNGGAIYNNGGVIVLSNCVLSANAAAGGNGGNGVVQLNGMGGAGSNGGNADGGALFNQGGSISLTNCTLSGNVANGGTGGNGADAGSGGNGNDGGAGGAGGSGGGGAIYNTAGGTIVAYDCTFASNSVSGAVMGTGGAGAGLLGANGANGIPGSGFGGAIYNSTGAVTVLFCTFNSNTAAGAGGGDGKSGAGDGKGSPGDSGSNAGGGGIYDRGGSLTATNCTFAGNSATGGAGGAGGAGGTQGFGGDGGNGGAGGGAAGGGVDNVDGGTAVLVNCTLTDNGAQGGTGGAGGTAGNSFTHAGNSGQAGTSAGGGIAAGSGTITLKNTLLGYSVAGENGSGNVSDGGNNLSDDASVPLPAGGSHTNVASLLLGTLGNNGGPTWTVPIISSNSPAVDAGNDAAAAPVDQRHQTRVGRSDIGAFEFNGVAAPARLIISLKTNLVVVSWTNTLYSYSLQSATNLPGHSWSYVTNTPAAVSNQFVLTNSADGPSRFYRLIK